MFIRPKAYVQKKPETLLHEAQIKARQGSGIQLYVFTRNFFTEDATHKQNCTSFNPESVITYSLINGKLFLNSSWDEAQN